jgi:hypothetical protein
MEISLGQVPEFGLPLFKSTIRDFEDYKLYFLGWSVAIHQIF